MLHAFNHFTSSSSRVLFLGSNLGLTRASLTYLMTFTDSHILFKFFAIFLNRTLNLNAFHLFRHGPGLPKLIRKMARRWPQRWKRASWGINLPAAIKSLMFPSHLLHWNSNRCRTILAIMILAPLPRALRLALWAF